MTPATRSLLRRLLAKPPDIGIASGAAAPVDILVAPNGIMERFSVMAPHDSWTYSITSAPSCRTFIVA